mgnify:CR=1 FL=1
MILRRALKNKLSPRVITSFPEEFALAVGHFSWNADLVTEEVVYGMLCVFTLFITLCQRFIAVGVSVNVSKSAVGFCAVFPLTYSVWISQFVCPMGHNHTPSFRWCNSETVGCPVQIELFSIFSLLLKKDC